MITYKKLFKMLIDRDMQKTDLLKAGLATATIAKLSKNQSVTVETIEKICRFLKCQPGDIMEYIEDDEG